ncbi:FkbM family methyltransferase [Flavobacterium selenitireducens]|uniref:FkbM family methyltransferase n=1 Tax=Flavobacterium selenitireducens TaxID=2722704 RepID=UPI00168B71FF|nr:FkbM family methyltransferase [Flavobacterium selenitireducens]MBD3581583.1 FkbM family methyltransferase [Flavobacterium selenitireducens]
MSLRTKIIQKLLHLNEGIFFYPKLRRFYRGVLKKENPQILDIGANKGQSIDFFLGIFPAANIDAFEPNQKLFSMLTLKYRGFGNVKLHNLGVSNINGKLEFNENALDETSTFETLNFDSDYLKKKARILGMDAKDIIVDRYEVEVVRLSDTIRGSDKAYDVLKIDVEGHELQVLQGLFDESQQRWPIRFIQLESHSDDMYLNHDRHSEIEDLLRKNGYARRTEIKHGFGNFAEIIYEQQ